MSSTVFDNTVARAALETIAAEGLPSARVCRALLTHADEAWGGRITCAIADAHDGETYHAALAAGTTQQKVLAFVERLPATFGHRPMTADELAREAKKQADEQAEQARRALITPPTPPAPDTGGRYSEPTGDGLRDASTWAREAYAAGDSLSDD